jgi:2-hydroxymuconate-semialdehyde hydrolase
MTTVRSTAIRSSDVTVGDYRIRVNESGDPSSPALVLLHGSGPGATGMSNWEGVLAELGRDFHCMAPDILGFGDSTHPEEPPVGTGPFAQLRAEVMARLLGQLGVRGGTVVGNSMGGMVTMHMLADDPTCFDRVVLMASGGAPVAGITPALMKLVLFYENPTTEAMADLMKEFVSDPAFLGDRLEAIAAARMPMATRHDVRRSHIATFTPVDTPMVDVAAISQIRQPVLAIHGQDDKLIPVAAAHWFGDHIDDCQVHTIPHCGHWVQIEQRDRFVFLVRAFALGLI